jgi:hypothetical protein
MRNMRRRELTHVATVTLAGASAGKNRVTY